MGAVAATVVGVGLLVLGWIGPMMISNVPYWLQLSLLALGVLLIVAGTALGLLKRKQRGEAGPGIHVRMRDRNTVGQIGHNYGRGREKENR
jgi:hypothetical protein